MTSISASRHSSREFVFTFHVGVLLLVLLGHQGPHGLWGVSAHIHVAPEYFQRCDAIPSPPTPITGGAWLLRELGSSAHFCQSSLGSLLECGQPTDAGEGPQGPPRELQALDALLPSVEKDITDNEAASAFSFRPIVANPVSGAPQTAPQGAMRDRKGPLAPSRSKASHSRPRSLPAESESGHQLQQSGQHHQQQEKQQRQQPQQPQQQHQDQKQQQQWNIFSLNSFVSSVLSSASLVAATELGDRTFFLAALLAVRYNRYLVFMATCGALFVASAFSAIAGHLLKNASDYTRIPGPLRDLLAGGVVVQWVSAVSLLLFGGYHILKAKKCFDLHDKAFREPSKRASVKLSSQLSTAGEGLPEGYTPEGALHGVPQAYLSESEGEERKSPQVALQGREAFLIAENIHETEHAEQTHATSPELEEAQQDVDRLQYTRLGLNPKAWRVLREVFMVILLAEWGDKSMFATISLATAQTPWGVFVGSCLGHAMVTLTGIIGGVLLQKWLNEFTLNLAAGLLMLAIGLGAAVEACSYS